MSRRRGRRAFLRSPARVVAATSEGSASATKDQTSAEPDPLKRLKDLGAIATAGLGAITTVLGVFGLREGIPERMLRNQPVAASLAFLLVGLGITLAVLSVAWFSKEHPRVEALRPRDERPDEQASKWARLRFQARRNWGLFLFGSTVFLAVVLFLLLSVGSLLGEIGLSFYQQSALALGSGLAVALALTVVWSVSQPEPGRDAAPAHPAARRPDGADDDRQAAEAAKRTRRLLIMSILYFAVGFLWISEMAVTAPGLPLRPQLTAKLDGNTLTSTFVGEGVGANRTYTVVVFLVPDGDEGRPTDAAANGAASTGSASAKIQPLHGVRVGPGLDGKVQSTITTPLPTDRGGQVIVVVVPSERLKRTDEQQDWWAHLNPANTGGVVTLEPPPECPGRYTVIACTQLAYVPRAGAQLSGLELTAGAAGKSRTLQFKMSAHGLAAGQDVHVTVSGPHPPARSPGWLGKRTLYEAHFPADATGALSAQDLKISLPAEVTRVCVNARIEAAGTGSGVGAVCPATGTPGGASAWVQLTPSEE